MERPGELCQDFSLNLPAQLSLGVSQSLYHLLNAGDSLHLRGYLGLVQDHQVVGDFLLVEFVNYLVIFGFYLEI